MSYQVLYRRFRPRSFDEIYGQDHIVKILKNQIISGNISHAYLFSGPRGTGKTSAAKVFARAINCENPINGEACGKCRVCISSDNDVLADVIEIDAASNRGIDEIRDLKDKVNYLPSNGKYRIYIIDEVHMLTTEAFNALLKTLEDPPEHIIFIFATTEVQKILPTILSRCQRYDFMRIPDSVIKKRLEDVLNSLDITYDESALDVICSSADGALRDALSITDKAINMNQSKHLSLIDTQEALGLTAQDDIIQIAKCIICADAGGALSALHDSLASGGDIENIVSSLCEYFRNLMVYSVTSNEDKLILKGDKYIDSLKDLTVNLNRISAVSYVSEFAKIKADSRFMQNMLYLTEAAIVKLTEIEVVNETASLSARIERLEKRFDGIIKGEIKPVRQATVEEKTDTAYENNEIPSIKSEIMPDISEASPEKIEDKSTPDGPTGKVTLKNVKNELIFAGNYINNSERDIMLQGFYFDLQPEYYDGSTLKVHPTGSSVNMMDVFEKHDGLRKLKTILAKKIGREVNIIITQAPDNSEENLISSAMEIFGGLEELTE